MINIDTILAANHSIVVEDGGGSITVDAVNLDIRNLVFADDKVDVSGSTVELGATTLAALESITVSGTVELGATTLAALESITVVDGGGSLTVDASDLDIRDLTHVSDSVKIGDGTDFLAIEANGSINVNANEAGYSSWSVVAASVDTTAGGTQLAAAPLSNRLRIEIQNLGSNDIYIRQATGVTTANGLKIPKGSSYEQALDAGAAIWAIAASGTADIRVAQYAA